MLATYLPEAETWQISCHILAKFQTKHFGSLDLNSVQRTLKQMWVLNLIKEGVVAHGPKETIMGDSVDSPFCFHRWRHLGKASHLPFSCLYVLPFPVNSTFIIHRNMIVPFLICHGCEGESQVPVRVQTNLTCKRVVCVFCGERLACLCVFYEDSIIGLEH